MNTKIQLVARILLGLIMTVFGLNKFLNFMPMPEPANEAVGSTMEAFMNTGYLMPMVGVVEVITGLMLLSGKYVQLALVLLAPITVNIIAFHLALDPSTIAAGALVAILNLYLLWANRASYQGMLTA